MTQMPPIIREGPILQVRFETRITSRLLIFARTCLVVMIRRERYRARFPDDGRTVWEPIDPTGWKMADAADAVDLQDFMRRDQPAG